ncbi:MAG TPA: hypothetical protein VEL75_19230 [Candidatus Methylomirabilis sp.]|nr:hypothetical protein [Candidatus Methylomirabilis sp.]
MAVVKSRMLPGEVIEVRSPNATAAVRGIVFVVEVDPVSAGQPSVAQITTRAHLFHGALDVSARLDPARPTVRLAELQSVVVTGNALGAIQPISRDAVAALTADLKPRQIQAPDAPIDFTSGLMAREQGRAVALATQLLTPVPNNPVQGTLKTVKGTVTTVTGSTAQVLAQLMNGLGDPAGATTLVKGVGDALGSTVNGTVGRPVSGAGGCGRRRHRRPGCRGWWRARRDQDRLGCRPPRAAEPAEPPGRAHTLCGAGRATRGWPQPAEPARPAPVPGPRTLIDGTASMIERQSGEDVAPARGIRPTSPAARSSPPCPTISSRACGRVAPGRSPTTTVGSPCWRVRSTNQTPSCSTRSARRSCRSWSWLEAGAISPTGRGCVSLTLPVDPETLASVLRAACEQARVTREARETTRQLEELNAIGVKLSGERDTKLLLDLILTKARTITRSDAASIYLVEDAGDGSRRLRFEMAQNESVPVELNAVSLPLGPGEPGRSRGTLG